MGEHGRKYTRPIWLHLLNRMISLADCKARMRLLIKICDLLKASLVSHNLYRWHLHRSVCWIFHFILRRDLLGMVESNLRLIRVISRKNTGTGRNLKVLHFFLLWFGFMISEYCLWEFCSKWIDLWFLYIVPINSALGLWNTLGWMWLYSTCVQASMKPVSLQLQSWSHGSGFGFDIQSVFQVLSQFL